MKPRRVILIVDQAFGSRLLDILSETPVWIVDSAENRVAVEARRTATGVSTTCFRGNPASAPTDVALAVLPSIEDHHGQFSQSPAFDSLTIIGAPSVPSLRASLADLGFEEVPPAGPVLEFVRRTG